MKTLSPLFNAITHLIGCPTYQNEMKVLSFNTQRTNYYYFRFFSIQKVRQEAVDNPNVILSMEQLDELTFSQLSTYSLTRKISAFEAARQGATNVIKYIHESNVPLYVKLLIKASEKGNLEVVKYLNSVANIPIHAFAMVLAAKNGHYQTLEYVNVTSKPTDTVFKGFRGKRIRRSRN